MTAPQFAQPGEPVEPTQLAFDDAPDSDFEVAAECRPPEYDEQGDPHNGALDDDEQE